MVVDSRMTNQAARPAVESQEAFVLMDRYVWISRTTAATLLLTVQTVREPVKVCKRYLIGITGATVAPVHTPSLKLLFLSPWKGYYKIFGRKNSSRLQVWAGDILRPNLQPGLEKCFSRRKFQGSTQSRASSELSLFATTYPFPVEYVNKAA